MKKININYNETFGTKHSRDYYRGLSFHYSGKWVIGTHYISDDYNIDYVVHGQCLLACAKSHLSSLENEPTEYIYDSHGNITGVVSQYWDFVLSGMNGSSCAVKIIDDYWYICNNANVPEEEQIWVNTGVKATFEYDDLTEEQKEDLRAPILEDVEHRLDTSTYLTTSEMNEIVSNPTDFYIWTENFGEGSSYTLQDYLYEYGYSSMQEMCEDAPESLILAGAQRFVNTETPIEIEGEIYDIWRLEYPELEEGAELYGVCPQNMNKQYLISQSMCTNDNNQFVPFVVMLNNDLETYKTPDEKYTLIYIEECAQ